MKQIVILDAVMRSCGILVIATLSAITQAHDPQFNNGSAEDYRRAASSEIAASISRYIRLCCLWRRLRSCVNRGVFR
jgi:hypothetical protein